MLKLIARRAFSISKEYQRKGLGVILIRKLSEAARENGIPGLMANTSPDNQAMIRLFNKLPFQIKTFYDGEMLMLSCRFDEPRKQAEKASFGL